MLQPIPVLISSCLLNKPVRYNDILLDWDDDFFAGLKHHLHLIDTCPEILGGLSVPRDPCEIEGEVTWDAPQIPFKVKTPQGTERTRAFVTGAEKTLVKAMEHKVVLAVLKERSPSCGPNLIYDGTFKGKTIPGMGVTASLLHRYGIPVFSETQMGAVKNFLELRGYITSQ